MHKMNWQIMIQEMMESGWTQEDIARACDCSQTVISFLKTGKRRNVKFKTGVKLIETYQILQNKK